MVKFHTADKLSLQEMRYVLVRSASETFRVQSAVSQSVSQVVGLDDVANLEVDHLPIFSATMKIRGVFLHAPI